MRNADRRGRREYLRETEEDADERALYLEALAGSTAAQLREVVRTHDAEAAIAAATVLLATQFRITVVGEGPDAEFLSDGRRRKTKPAKAGPPANGVTRAGRGGITRGAAS